ncbi:hypothetical protein [Methylosoma difficile]
MAVLTGLALALDSLDFAAKAAGSTAPVCFSEVAHATNPISGTTNNNLKINTQNPMLMYKHLPIDYQKTRWIQTAELAANDKAILFIAIALHNMRHTAAAKTRNALKPDSLLIRLNP